MKQIATMLVLLLLVNSCKSNAQGKELKRYNVKSGKITYRITTNGKVIASTITGEGTASCNFKNWGAIERKEEKINTTTVTKIPFGPTKRDVQNSHTMNKLVSGESYGVDFDKKIIYVNDDIAMNLVKVLHPNKNAEEVGRKGMESLGEKTGTENVLGYNCEIWETMGVKQWVYKGVPLKIESNLAGIHIVQRATSAKFNISISEKDLKLPDYKLVKQQNFIENEAMDEEMDNMKDNMKNMSFAKWKIMVTKNDPEMRNMSDKELRDIYNMMQKMLK